MYKSTLRKHYKHLRNNLDTKTRQTAEDIILSRIIQSDEFKRAESLFAFASHGSEVSTEGIINKAFELNKRVAFPRVINKEEMCFIYVSSLEELRAGSYGIWEPEYSEDKIALPDETTLMLVPALAYDAYLNRLGYGGGYYDRYLEKHTKPCKVGIGFHIQYTQSHLPHNPRDIPVDILITEKIIKKGAVK